jgi:hypothetical protein
MAFIAVIGDLMFTSKVRETAKALNKEVFFVKKSSLVDGVLSKLATEPAGVIDAIFVDLNLQSDDPLAVVQAIPQWQQHRVIAFVSHVQTELFARARDFGISNVMARSQFVSSLSELLQETRKATPSQTT